jgi:NadR type nicotinamide-nucleotide adenylyltransferase
MPPHKGHQYLVEFARARVGRLTVLLLSRGTDPIPGELRFAWMRSLFPGVEVVHVCHDLPTDYQDPAVWDRWIALIRQACPCTPEVVFSSEAYGDELARRLGAAHQPVDPSRVAVPISATQIREQPEACRHYLPECVWAYLEQLQRRAATGGSG